MNKAFEDLKQTVCLTASLTIPTREDVFLLQTDASGGGIGGVLNVVRDDVVVPTAFFSKQLKTHQRNYSATELEALAMVESILHFAMFLYSRSFTVEVDHQPLLVLPTGNKLNRRLRGLWLKVTDYHFKIRYRKGEANSNADGLSRQPWPDQPTLHK